METAGNLVEALKAIIASLEENAEKARKIFQTGRGTQNQRIIDYAEGMNFGLQIARLELEQAIKDQESKQESKTFHQ